MNDSVFDKIGFEADATGEIYKPTERRRKIHEQGGVGRRARDKSRDAKGTKNRDKRDLNIAGPSHADRWDSKIICSRMADEAGLAV